MHNFELSLNEEMSIYIKSGLTPTEFFVVRLLLLAAEDHTKYIVDYVSNISNGKQLVRSVLESLMSKKVINSTFKMPKEGESLNFKAIPFNKHFINMYIKESHQLGKEFYDAYPPFININGKMCSIRNFTKAGIYSFEDFCIFYSKQLKNANATHERVMAALEFAKENNLINYTILEFIASKKYEEIEFIMNSGDINGYSNSELL